MNYGKFITFEGGEGSGKTTQIALLERALKAAGDDVLLTREPGGTPAAEQIRELLVKGMQDRWDPVAETMLFYAARLEHVNRKIKPALAENTTVLCDRFSDSTLVYQGYGKHVDPGFIERLDGLVLEGFCPDLTVILDIDPKDGLQRAQGRKGDETRFEHMHMDFHNHVRDGFLSIARKHPKRCVVIDASPLAAQVHEAIITAINNRLGFKLKPVEMSVA